MSDEELVKRLRGMDGDSMSIKTLDEAADRIEALTAELAKAVEAMEFWLQAQEPDFDAAIDLMQATLAELKGRPRK